MDDKYQRIKVLGKGSFGKAYLVRNTETDTKCVVKQMECGSMDPKERNEAVKEALMLKRMDHPNIVRFQEVFMTRKGRLCIVMDYADGGDVHMELKRQEGRLLPEDRILEWFVQTCFALKHVHGRKVLHRDLKTQNIFLMSTGQIKLGDFGIARVLDATKDYAKTMVGTPYYLSPEIIEDRPYNFKSDVWSCGVVLYEMATLTHPFDADSLVILAGKILRDEYPPPNHKYSQELKDLIRSMLCKSANLRPLISEVLCNPFLQGPMDEANAKYNLGIDLSEYKIAIARATAAAAAEEGDVVLMGTLVSRSGTVGNPEPSPTHSEVAAVNAAGGDSEYDEEFEDYSGSEDGEKRAQSDIQASVANLKLGDGRKPSHDPGQQARAEALTSEQGDGGARIGAKVASLRSYLLSQISEAEFLTSYDLVRGASTKGVLPEHLQAQVSCVIGDDKAPELVTLFQLLCFLEDVEAQQRGAI